MASLSPIVLEPAAQEVTDATSHPVEPRRLVERRKRGLGETLLLIGVAAVAGPLVVAVAGTIVLLTLAVTGPFLLPVILLLALVVVVLVATGAAG